MKKTAAIFAVVTLLIAFFVASAWAQVPAPVKTPPPCPTATVTAGPGGIVFAPQPIMFTLAVANGEPNVRPFYSWSVSAGSITAGQGTPTIHVDTTDAGAY